MALFFTKRALEKAIDAFDEERIRRGSRRGEDPPLPLTPDEKKQLAPMIRAAVMCMLGEIRT